MKNRKYKEVNKKEFNKIKGLLENFSVSETERIVEQLGNERSYSTISKIDKAENIGEYRELVKEATAQRRKQMGEEGVGEKGRKLDEALIEDLKGAYNKIGILLKHFQSS